MTASTPPVFSSSLSAPRGEEGFFAPGEVVEVLVPLPFATGFDYRLPEDTHARTGQYVAVPFGPREVIGIVRGAGRGEVETGKIKPLRRVFSDLPPLSEEFLKFLEWVADYTLSPLGLIVKMVVPVPEALSPPPPRRGIALAATLPPSLRMTGERHRVIAFLKERNADLPAPTLAELAEASGTGESVLRGLLKAGALQEIPLPERTVAKVPLRFSPVPLNEEQREAADKLCLATGQGYQVFVLEGVTGSGKTEVYYEAIDKAVREGGQALVLLPEIGLSAQWMQRFTARFGQEPTLWHSGLTEAQRRRNWRRIATGEAQVIVGARSALFLPYPRLSLLVVDEEHEATYKQEEGVCYHARDMAIARGWHGHLPVVLVSATPSLETLYNMEHRQFQRLHLSGRYGEATLPTVALVDMRKEKLPATEFLSASLRRAMQEALEKGEQTLLFLNRRGYAPLVLCRGCGHRFTCSQCSAWLVYHRKRHHLQCHHCGHREAFPTACPSCSASEDKLIPCGPGVERIAEEARHLFPEARIATMTSDEGGEFRKAAEIIERMEAGAIDILIGTQMLAKGYHFPRLTLVGVVDADMGLTGGDLRAGERTFQLLMQIGGRAGRESSPGRVMLQSFTPEHPLLQALARHDTKGFLALEVAGRKRAAMPPYGRLASVILDGVSEEKVRVTGRKLVAAAPPAPGIHVLGPAPAPLSRLQGKFRYRLLVHAPREGRLQPYLHRWLSGAEIPSSVRLKIDVDPYSFW
jgi:primosomal protein N' (replication factor Y)